MENMLTKKNVLIISGLIGGGLLLLEPVKTSTICGASAISCIDTVFVIAMCLFVLPFVFFFSLITYFLPESVFRAWIHFTKWWVPPQIILVALTPEGTPGAFITILDKQFAAIILSALFVLVSLSIIIWKYIVARKSKAL